MSEYLHVRIYPTELEDRLDQFSSILGVDPNLLNKLRFCSACNGDDYVWTDWAMLELPDGFTTSFEEARS